MVQILTWNFNNQLVDWFDFRPLSDEEQKLNVQKVVSCNEQKREVTVMQSLNNKQVDKLFTFDRVNDKQASLHSDNVTS